MQDRISTTLENLLEHSGRILSVLPLLLILLQFSVVIMVYVFKLGSIQLQESLQYINAFMFLGGAGYTALRDEHVRVDLFYSKLTEQNKAKVNFFGMIFLLIPFLWLFAQSAVPYMADSWRIMETSIESSGLPFVYILKSTLILFPLTLALHVVASLLRNFKAMRAQ